MVNPLALTGAAGRLRRRRREHMQHAFHCRLILGESLGLANFGKRIDEGLFPIQLRTRGQRWMKIPDRDPKFPGGE